MAESLEAKLLDMKEQIEQASMRAAKAKGALDELYKRLKTEFNVTDLDEAEVLLIELKEKAEQLEDSIEKQVEELEKNYEWR